MPIGMRTLGSLMLAATAFPVVLAGISPGFDRLATMPPRTRLELAARLDRFDRLPSTEQRSIRALDEAIARLDPEERRRYLDLMRRFGAWARGLDEDSRAALQSAPPDRRLELVRERLGPAGSPESPGLDPALWVRADTFNPIPLYDAAALLRVWAVLDDPGRARVESARAFDEKLAALRQLARDREIEPAPAVREEFRAIIEKLWRRNDPGPPGGRFGAEVGDLPSWLLDPTGPPSGRSEDESKSTQRRTSPTSPGPPESPRSSAPPRLTTARLALLRMAELEYLRQLRERPEASPAAGLLAFESRLPDWYRGTLDPLPSEMARGRIRALHRLVLDDPDIRRWLSTAVPAGPSGRPEPPGGGRSPLVTPF